MSNSGPASQLKASVTMLNAEITIISGAPGVSRSGSAAGCQNASAHVRPMDNSVSRPTTSTTPPTQYAPAANAPSRMASLPRKPDNGGTPASEKIGTIAIAANNG